MATTVVAPVGNSISLAAKYLPLLDEVYKREALTAILDTDASRVNWVGANAVNIFKFDAVGMGNYSRNSGYVPGDANGSWETKTIELDRGRSYQIDYLDNEETLGMMVGRGLGEIERVSVIPEWDAYTFATLAGTAGIGGATATVVPGTTNVADLIGTAEASMDDDEVPYEGRILFVNPTVYNVLKGNIERRIINSENNVNTNVEYYDDMRIIRVPKGRFNTQITLAAPTAHDGTGGYTASGADINFMIVHPSAVLKTMKHYVPRLFTPEQNIEADAYRINYRYCGGVWVLDNKKKGIYCHKAAVSSN